MILSGQCQMSASKMMIGIGTPSSQSRIPRPMFVSIACCGLDRRIAAKAKPLRQQTDRQCRGRRRPIMSPIAAVASKAKIGRCPIDLPMVIAACVPSATAALLARLFRPMLSILLSRAGRVAT
jgi:hypothetical protein